MSPFYYFYACIIIWWYVTWCGQMHVCDFACTFVYSFERIYAVHRMFLRITTRINSSPPSTAYIRQWTGSALVQIMARRLFGAKPLNQCWVNINWTLRKNFSDIFIKIQNFLFTKMHLKISSAKWRPFCPGEDKLAAPNTYQLISIYDNRI